MSSLTLAREELARIAPAGDSAVTIGKFDGVHRGHKHLLASFKQEARNSGLASVALTLHPNPLTVLRPGTPVTYLCSLEERLALLRAQGLDRVGILSFTSELSQLSARDFVSLLIGELRMKLLFIGPDLALGRGREGSPDVLRRLGQELGFRVQIAPILIEGEEKVGSSAIRKALAAGDMESVAHFLGRPYALSGPVIVGDKRGRQLGYPTANIAVARDIAFPRFGVYITRAYLQGESFLSCTNIGVRPTFDDTDPAPTIETFILDFNGDIYGRELHIEVLHRLRDELKFESVPALIAAIEQDVAETRAYFARHG
ncbi:MAG TPA: bifunctional riboflavin kinase/FAD synthetase [Dehalococcoidia bacterium]|nr:bifunctional riboflavin kinase/FAD synthetase [Dehalococcoidia bacterium]